MHSQFEHMMNNAYWRHSIFWLCWILGFTFVKSFGEGFQAYTSWFAYYLITLPLFMSHTYLVSYFLLPRFGKGQLWTVFAFLFLFFFFGFSILELVLSQEIIFRYFPSGEIQEGEYLQIANIIRSGVGNLYIVLVFLAAKSIWDWSRYSLRQKALEKEELQEQMADAMSRVQPLMLVYAIDHIEEMSLRGSTEVSRAIALTSELLSDVMMYHREGKNWITREIELVKKLVELLGLLKNRKPVVEFFISGDPGEIDMPSMLLFSFMDLLFRVFDSYGVIPEINIEASGYSNMLSIQVILEEGWRKDERVEECMNALAGLRKKCNGIVDIDVEHHAYGCSVVMRATHPVQEDEYPVIPATH